MKVWPWALRPCLGLLRISCTHTLEPVHPSRLAPAHSHSFFQVRPFTSPLMLIRAPLPSSLHELLSRTKVLFAFERPISSIRLIHPSCLGARWPLQQKQRKETQMQREHERQNITDFLPFYGRLTRSHNFDLLPSKEPSRVMMFKPFEMPFFVHLWCLNCSYRPSWLINVQKNDNSFKSKIELLVTEFFQLFELINKWKDLLAQLDWYKYIDGPRPKHHFFIQQSFCDLRWSELWTLIQSEFYPQLLCYAFHESLPTNRCQHLSCTHKPLCFAIIACNWFQISFHNERSTQQYLLEGDRELGLICNI